MLASSGPRRPNPLTRARRFKREPRRRWPYVAAVSATVGGIGGLTGGIRLGYVTPDEILAASLALSLPLTLLGLFLLVVASSRTTTDNLVRIIAALRTPFARSRPPRSELDGDRREASR